MEENKETQAKAAPLIEGLDFYFEDGLMVLTGRYLLNRGYCCGNGCRHCPYGDSRALEQEDLEIG